MPVARPESSDARVIAHVDMDCFYVQVEQRRQPELRGQPAAVVQYNTWKGGGLIAVGYEARKFGVKRSMRGDDAKKVCPNIHLIQVPVARGKADLTIYRDAGSEVVTILSRKGRCERASIDEVYLDLTDAAEAMLAESPPESFERLDEEALKSHILGLDEDDGDDAKEHVRKWLCDNIGDHRDKLLACGAIIVAELRWQVLEETQFTCSAGVAHNKMLAKLASGMNKPAQQTIVPHSAVKDLLDPLPIKKMKQLGGKLGDSLQMDLGVKTVGDLLQFSEGKLQERYGANTGTWLWNIARGNSGDEVQGRLLPKSHGSGKTFPGRQSLKTLSSVHRWLNDLCEDLSERLQADLDKNKRIARTLTLHANAYKSSEPDSQKKFPSKSCPLRYGTAKVQDDAFNLFHAALREFLGACQTKSQVTLENDWGITGLSVSASKIDCIPVGTCTIKKYFQGRGQNYTSDFEPNSYIEGNDSDMGFVKGSKEKIPLEETRTGSALCDLDSHGQNKQSQGTSTIGRYFQDQDPNCSSEIKAPSCSKSPVSLLQSGKDSEPSSNLDDLKSCVPLVETSTLSAQYDRNRQEKKRKSQGTSSIMSFFLHSGSSQQAGGVNTTNYFKGKDSDQRFVKGSKEEIYLEEAMTGSALCNLESQGQNKHKQSQVQGTSTIGRYFQHQDPHCSSEMKAASCSKGAASFAQSGKDSEPSSSLDDMKSCVPPDETSTMSEQYDRTRHEQKRKSQQGTSSIMSFFQNSSSTQQPGNGNTTNDFKELQRCEMHNGLHSCSRVEEQAQRQRSSWEYAMDEIDLAVMNELPREIQDELRMWLQPQKRKLLASSIVSKSGGARATKESGSGNIRKYFHPSKKQTD